MRKPRFTKGRADDPHDEIVVVEAGGIIPRDGTVIEGVAWVNESAMTGESAPVLREAGTDRSAVLGGTVVLSDRLVIDVSRGASR